MEQLRWIYKETLNCEGNKAEDSEHEHEARWKGNVGEWPGSKERQKSGENQKEMKQSRMSRARGWNEPAVLSTGTR